jgi:ankyrin repeat protein
MIIYYEFRDRARQSDLGFLDFIKRYSKELLLENSDSLMTLASKYGRVKSLEFLLENDFDIHFSEEICLKWASQNGHLDIVKLLIENGADIHAKEDYALSIACRNGHFEIVKYLVANGANIHTWSDQPLLWSLLSKHDDISLFLIKNNADCNAQAEILDYACCNGNIEILNLIIERGINVSNLINLGKRRAFVTNFLMDNFNLPDNFLNDILINACRFSDIEIVTCSLDNGADINSCNGMPLSYAIKNKNTEISKYLIERGADVSLINN